MNGKRGSGPRGFTLVELLTVVAIIALLLAILLPNFAKVKELARRSVCATNLKNLGTGWGTYWTENNKRIPKLSYSGDNRGDSRSTYNMLIVFSSTTYWCNAGVLYSGKHVAGEQVYLCPTLVGNFQPWFSPNPPGTVPAGFFQNSNPWPPPPLGDGRTTKMTYGTRRMKPFTDPTMADVAYNDPRFKDYLGLMVRNNTTEQLGEPSRYSWMGDCFAYPDIALKGHVPGANILFLDGSVRFFQTSDDTILYNNGLLPTYDLNSDDESLNWFHDNIWNKIDDLMNR